MDSVSVVVATYNRAHLLPRALESVEAQTRPADEIIVVDDASTDDTRDVVARLGMSSLRYVRHDRNRGGAVARNTGIAAATGDWVAFLDSDDAWLPQKLEAQLRRLHDIPEAGAATSADFFVESQHRRRTRYEHVPENLTRFLLHTNFSVASSFIVAREVLEEIGGFDTTLPSCQDWDLLLRTSQATRVEHVPTPLVCIYALPSEPGITRGNPFYVDGFERFRQKHDAAIRAEGGLTVAVNDFRIGQAYALHGMMEKARAAFRRAMAYRPWRTRMALHWLATWTGASVYRAFVDLRRRFAPSVAPASWRTERDENTRPEGESVT